MRRLYNLYIGAVPVRSFRKFDFCERFRCEAFAYFIDWSASGAKHSKIVCLGAVPV